MSIQCEYCGKETEDDNSVFCKYCGFRYRKTELDVLKNIEALLIENQKSAEKSSKTQTRISFATLIISIVAFLIALGALLIFVVTQPIEQRLIGLGIVFFVIFLVWLIFKKYNVAPIDLDEIE